MKKYSDMIKLTIFYHRDDKECDSVRTATVPSFPKACKRFKWSEIQRDDMLLKHIRLSNLEELRAIVKLVGYTTSLLHIDAL